MKAMKAMSDREHLARCLAWIDFFRGNIYAWILAQALKPLVSCTHKMKEWHIEMVATYESKARWPVVNHVGRCLIAVPVRANLTPFFEWQQSAVCLLQKAIN